MQHINQGDNKLTQRYELTVKKRIKWLMKMRIMTALLMMRSICLMARVTVVRMQMLMRAVIVPLKLAAELKKHSTNTRKAKHT